MAVAQLRAHITVLRLRRGVGEWSDERTVALAVSWRAEGQGRQLSWFLNDGNKKPKTHRRGGGCACGSPWIALHTARMRLRFGSRLCQVSPVS